MPVSPQRKSEQPTTTTNTQPNNLRPYTFHGIQLTKVGNSEVIGDCPFCGKDGKFYVQTTTSKFQCKVCNAYGNALEFLRLLHERSVHLTTPEFRSRIAQDRRLLSGDTASAWGVCIDLGASWVVPGYSPDGKLNQLYRRTRINGVWCLLPTPGIWPEGKVHALHLPHGLFDPMRPNVWVLEGPWDGMAMWEVAHTLHPDTNIIAVPGCNVWRDEWSEMCRGKNATLMYDSDHPIPEALKQGKTIRPGLDGMCRVAKRLSGIATSVKFIRWGQDGYDPEKPSGWDVRDYLSSSTDRKVALAELLAKVELAPSDWFTPHHLNGATPSSNGHVADIVPEDCNTWQQCETAWKAALEWRSGLGDAMCTMLAVAASVNQAGDNQLFLQVIADPGSAKTRLCKGLLVSKKCKQLTHLKSFHSGYKGEDGKDVSLVSRINGLCLVTPEADALQIGMSWDQLNSQMRQIFDGDTGHTYGNSSEDVQYKGLRSPWIQAGTPALMDKDQSRLGDRFLRIRIEEPLQDTKRAIMLRSLRNERLAVLETANGTEGSIIPTKLRKAYALTGGYVDWLRTHIEEKIALVDMDESAENRCCDLAELTSDMRARPNMDPKKHEVHHTKELGSRLAGQFVRLALCLAVVLNKQLVDNDVLRIVCKVAMDTSYGHTLNIVQWLCSPNPRHNNLPYQQCGGLMQEILISWSGMQPEKLLNYLIFLRSIGVLERREVKHTHGTWLLTQRVYELYRRVRVGW